MERRDFLTTMALTGAAASSSALLLPGNAEAANKVDIGEVKNVKIDVLSETSWFNNDNLKKASSITAGRRPINTLFHGMRKMRGLFGTNYRYHT